MNLYILNYCKLLISSHDWTCWNMKISPFLGTAHTFYIEEERQFNDGVFPVEMNSDDVSLFFSPYPRCRERGRRFHVRFNGIIVRALRQMCKVFGTEFWAPQIGMVFSGGGKKGGVVACRGLAEAANYKEDRQEEARTGVGVFEGWLSRCEEGDDKRNFNWIEMCFFCLCEQPIVGCLK